MPSADVKEHERKTNPHDSLWGLVCDYAPSHPSKAVEHVSPAARFVQPKWEHSQVDMATNNLKDKNWSQQSTTQTRAPKHEAKSNDVCRAGNPDVMFDEPDRCDSFGVQRVAQETVEDQHGPHDALVVSEADALVRGKD